MSNKHKLKLNESFSIRLGWLQKGINIVHDDSPSFSKDDAPVEFGLGSNMCKALKYYLGIADLVDCNSKGKSELRECGKALYEHDKYLESPFSLFVIHINMLFHEYTNSVGYFYFNNLSCDSMTKEEIFNKLKECLTRDSEKINEKSLNNDLGVLIRNYTENEEILNPEEDAYNSPLSVLSLIKKDGNTYKKTCPPLSVLDSRILMYNIKKIIEEGNVNTDEISIDSLIKCKNSPVRTLNLTENAFLYYLEDLDKKGYIKLTKTAGLNTVKLVKDIKDITIDRLFNDYKEEHNV